MTASSARPRLLIVTGIFPPDHGGPATYVPAIAAALADRFEIVAVVTGSDAATGDDGAYPYPVVRIPRRLNRLRRIPRTVRLLYRLAATADIVYLNGMVLEGIVACTLLRRRPVAVKVVGDRVWEMARTEGATDRAIEAFQRAPGDLKWRLLHRLQGWYTARADRTIVPSRYLGRVVAGWGVPAERIACIYNAAPEAPATADGHEKTADVISVCRLVPWKGLEALIEIAARRGWRTVIVGDGPEREALRRRIAALKAEELIALAGAVPPGEVTRLLRRARVMVLNSSYEGLPHAVLEAMAAGTPVVATDAGGTSELVEDGRTGRLVPVGDSRALEAAVAALLADPALAQRLAQAARDDIGRRFGFSAMVEATARTLEDTMAASRRSGKTA